MEMQAAIAALEFLQENNIADTSSEPVTLHTDSEYLKNGITKWIKGWKKKGWKTSSGKPVLNKDLWQQLDQLSQSLSADQLKIDWRYVRGHAGNPGNERCDEIARAYSHSQPISLKQHKVSGNTASTTQKKNTPQKAKASPKSEAGAEDQKSQPNDEFSSHKDLSLGNPEINTTTTQESSPTTALRFDENDLSAAPQEESQAMTTASASKNSDQIEPARITRLRNALETLQVTDELAKQGYLITSAELADLMDVNASAVTSRGDYWAWRNWTVPRIRREGNQILWQLERIDE